MFAYAYNYRAPYNYNNRNAYNYEAPYNYNRRNAPVIIYGDGDIYYYSTRMLCNFIFVLLMLIIMKIFMDMDMD